MTRPPHTDAPGSSAPNPVTHPRFQLNEAIHQPVKLSILSSLAHAERVDFAFLRDYLGLKDSNLSQHLTALESLGYITIEKLFEKKRARTWLAITSAGRAAFEEYLAVLRLIVAQSEQPPDS